MSSSLCQSITQYSTYREPDGRTVTLPRDRCPICGYVFEPVNISNDCPTCKEPDIKSNELITEYDDYAWCE